MAKRRRKGGYFRFTEKSHSVKGITALILAVILVIIFIVFLYRSFQSGGNLSVYYGSIGVAAVIISLVVFIMAVQSMFEENSFRGFPRAALFVSFLALLGWGGTYALGFLL